MITINQSELKGLGRHMKHTLPWVEEMKYKEGVERNVGMQGECLPAESA